jgi:hypothetical protein
VSMPVPTRSPLSGEVAAVDRCAAGTALRVSSPHGTSVVRIPWVADAGAAERWQASLRRIDRVVLWLDETTASAEVSGIGHRLPVRRHIPISAALALWDQGVPVHVQETL